MNIIIIEGVALPGQRAARGGRREGCRVPEAPTCVHQNAGVLAWEDGAKVSREQGLAPRQVAGRHGKVYPPTPRATPVPSHEATLAPH